MQPISTLTASADPTPLGSIGIDPTLLTDSGGVLPGFIISDPCQLPKPRGIAVLGVGQLAVRRGWQAGG
ncbi:MAG: hypothetical protein HIU82_00955 [Proteobacteria bacterium]|nr:hypothetical protein [Pseudomonadota bacterium]